jgi:hypothetical protein
MISKLYAYVIITLIAFSNIVSEQRVEAQENEIGGNITGVVTINAGKYKATRD